MKHDLLSFTHYNQQDLQALLNSALDIKKYPKKYATALAGKSVVGLFEKPSLRTRVSFDIGINKLGGHFLYLDMESGNLSGRESGKDMAAFPGYCD